MKTYYKNIALLLTIILTSCTDVIDVEVQVAAPRLVIEASIDWEKGTLGNEQTIKLSTSTPYFDSDEISIVTGASVKVTNDNDGTEFVFLDQNNGNYTVSNFIPEINQSYTLEVIYEGETYNAHENMMSVVDIDAIYQTTEKGFDNEVLEINADFNDPIEEENYYLFKLKRQNDLLPILLDISDEFTNGNLTTVFYEREKDEDINQEEFVVGDIVDVEFYGISEQYYNYIGLLIVQYESLGDPFSTTPVPLKGNCTNTTSPENYAFGYFRLSQVVKDSYTFE
ncbi:DUF4249 domain-containing protein [uncultured Lutibacter sp.]|uniref:DUF4249 domain-containing protein n=1 Tax=uncultured Lutibacter sp. TaxID=437739 RepID=UPI002608D307|nr:DUF4249 domain-containing protein [uncultured Lutibacter sp.]